MEIELFEKPDIRKKIATIAYGTECIEIINEHFIMEDFGEPNFVFAAKMKAKNGSLTTQVEHIFICFVSNDYKSAIKENRHSPSIDIKSSNVLILKDDTDFRKNTEEFPLISYAIKKGMNQKIVLLDDLIK